MLGLKINLGYIITNIEPTNQSPKNMGNLGTRFLRKVPKSEEGLTRISRINVAKTGGKGYYKRL